MKKVVLLKPEDMPLWDEFVNNHPYGWLCHLSGWKEVIEKSFKHIKGYFLTVWDDEAKAITAGLPVYSVKSWLTGRRIVSAPFATLFDPLISSSDDMDLLLPGVLDVFKTEGCLHIEIRTFLSAHLIKNEHLGYATSFKHHYVSLDKSLDGIMKAFHRTAVRPSVKKSSASGMKIKVADDKKKLCQFYNLYFMTRKNLGLPPMPFIFFDTIWNNFWASKKVIFLIAEYHSRPVSALMAFKFKDRLSAEYMGWDRRFHELRPTAYIYWEAIKLAHNEGCDIFDFGRTSIHNKSLLDFKRRWGTEEIAMTEFFYPAGGLHKNTADKEGSWKYQLVKKSSKWSPDFLFQLIGNFCYRHMG